jgi:transposase
MLTIGVDLGDKWSHLCVLDEAGEVAEEGRIATRREAFEKHFRRLERARVAIEAGTHSPWVRELLEACGHDVLVANSSKVRLIYENDRKRDEVDAEWLARLARLEPRLLAPIQHRDKRYRRDLAVLRSRSVLVRTRTSLINHVRGVVKAFGERVPSSGASSFHKCVAKQLPAELRPALAPIIGQIAVLTKQIQRYDRQVEQLAHEQYPETALLRQVSGVGAVTAATFVMTIGDPNRFRSSRTVGAYLGLRPKKRQSGGADPQLRISKAGDQDLRRLLVIAAHYILGPFGPDSDLRRWGLALTSEGDKNSRKRAVVAVARKLAVLLHRLWVTAQVYEPLRNTQRRKFQQQPQPAA